MNAQADLIPAKPQALAVLPENIPDTLRHRPQWLVWRYQWRNGKWTKPPYNARTGKAGKSNDPATWSDFETALNAYQTGDYDGIGFAFHESDGLAGVDLDHVINTGGELSDTAIELLARFGSTYVEQSPGGDGLRIFVLGKPTRCGKGTADKSIELYADTSPRYLTVTGHHWSSTSHTVTQQQAALDWLHGRHFALREAKPTAPAKSRAWTAPQGDDGALIERALKAKGGAKLRALLAGDISSYPSHSEADLALCSILAFWTDRNPEQMDRIFRTSGLMSDKWDAKHHADGRTYGAATLDKAVQSVTKTYGGTLANRAARLNRKAGTAAPTEVQDASWPRAEWRPETITELGDTDVGNAQRLFDRRGRDMLFVKDVSWHVWSGTRWTPDEAGVKREADNLPRLVLAEAAERMAEAAQATDPQTRDRLHGAGMALSFWAKKCEKSAAIEGALQMLERRLIIEPTEADADPFLLAVGNGTLDLRTGQLRPSIRGEFITKGTDIVFDPKATCPTFDAFMARIFRSHPEVIPFLQRAIGYTLTGDTREQCVFIPHGHGANGKSTLIGIVKQLLGDYAKQAAPELILTKTGDRHPTEIADLRGARLVSAIETGEGRRLAESLVKQMSGGDPLKGRYMRRDFFEFMPTFKLWLATNHLPNIRGTDHGIWRRIRLIPFLETIGDDEKDPALPAKLQAELPGILAWAVRGCLEWQRNGLQPPAVVLNATADYRAKQDVLAAFLDECCVVDRRAEVKAADLYKAYTQWCEDNGEYADKQRSFGDRLIERGVEREKGTAGARMYKGIGLLTSGASGASGANLPISHTNGVSKDDPQNYATNATCATQDQPAAVTCPPCVYWNVDRCTVGLTVSDPHAARYCGPFQARPGDEIRPGAGAGAEPPPQGTTPPLVACGDCRHFKRDRIGDGSGIGRCAVLDIPPGGLLYPRVERRCPRFEPPPTSGEQALKDRHG